MNANGVNTSIASAIDVRGWANKRGNMGGYQLATRHERTQFAFLKINWKNITYLRWRLYLIFALTWMDSGAVLQDINWSFSATRQTARTKLIRYIWSLTLSVQPKCIEVKKTANVHWATELGLINFVITPRAILKIGIAYGNEYRRVSSVGRNEAKICGERQIYSKRDANNHIFIHAAHWAQNSTQAKRQLSQREEAHWVFCRRFSLIYWETTSVFCEKRMLPFFPSLVRVWAFQSAPTVNAIRQIEDFFFVFGLAPPPRTSTVCPNTSTRLFFVLCSMNKKDCDGVIIFLYFSGTYWFHWGRVSQCINHTSVEWRRKIS